MSDVLVTGADGFVGRHAVAALRARGHDVLAVGRAAGDVRARATWDALPRADVVVHLAARQFVPDSWDDPTGFVETNVAGAVHALDHARRHGARVVHASSYLYGMPAALPIREDAPTAATNPYALSKLLAEAACRFYAERYAVPVVVLRPFNVYGPGQAPDFLIPTIVRQALAGGPVRVKDLAPRRDYVHVRDVAAAIAAAAAFDPRAGGSTEAPYAVFNVGAGTSHSVAEVIDGVARALGRPLEVAASGERRPGEIMDTVADVSAAREKLGWWPTIALDAGLAEVCAAERSSSTAAPHVKFER